MKELENSNEDEKAKPHVDNKEKSNEKIYYRSMLDDTELYAAIEQKYKKYISEGYLLQCQFF